MHYVLHLSAGVQALLVLVESVVDNSTERDPQPRMNRAPLPFRPLFSISDDTIGLKIFRPESRNSSYSPVAQSYRQTNYLILHEILTTIKFSEFSDFSKNRLIKMDKN